LVQLGLLDPAKLPVAGAESARKALDPAAVPSNLLMKRTITDELL
jgi:carboxymethylenebutenolidase